MGKRSDKKKAAKRLARNERVKERSAVSANTELATNNELSPTNSVGTRKQPSSIKKTSKQYFNAKPRFERLRKLRKNLKKKITLEGLGKVMIIFASIALLATSILPYIL